MTVEVFFYPKCGTCRSALKWLDAHGVAYQATDVWVAPPPASKLAELHLRSGLPIARFFNTSGEHYRAGGFKEKLKTLSHREALAELAKDGKLLKRPIVDAGETVLVGFDQNAYAAAFR